MSEPRSDIGEETQRFQAFQDRKEDLPPAWKMRAGGSRITVLVVVVVVVAILAVVLGMVLVG